MIGHIAYVRHRINRLFFAFYSSNLSKNEAVQS